MSYLFFIAAAALLGASAIWVLGAYRRALGEAKPRAAPAFAVALVAIGAVVGIYLLIGRPDLPDAPYAARIAALKARNPDAGYTNEEVLAILGEAARSHPAEAEPLVYSGQVLLELRRTREAARAFDAALRRDPHSAAAMLGLGQALVRLDEGRVSPEARRLFIGAAEGAPDDPRPWLYQAIAAGQNGETEVARALWRETLRRLPPDDPRRAMAEEMSRAR
jgi:cytochrome c-type biogenesis protein CcmH